MIRAAVEEAVAPLRDRVDGLEQTMLEAIVRVTNPTRASVPPRPSSRPTASQPPPLPPAAHAATGAPRAATSAPPQPKTAPADTIDAEDAEELTVPPPTAEQLTTPPAVQAFVVPAPVTPAPEAKDAAWEQMVRSSEQRRRMVMAVVAGLVVLGLGAFFGLLAACS